MVICRVGEHRLAFPAEGVVMISEWSPGDAAAPHARSAFALSPAPGRRLEGDQGTLVVDSLEIAAERFSMLAVPPMLQGAIGGALLGFIVLAGGLCPVLSVSGFARFLAGRQA